METGPKISQLMVHDISPNFRVILDRTSPDPAWPVVSACPDSHRGWRGQAPDHALADERAIDANNFRRAFLRIPGTTWLTRASCRRARILIEKWKAWDLREVGAAADLLPDDGKELAVSDEGWT